MSICINSLHTDVRMFCSLLFVCFFVFLPSLYHCCHFLQIVLLVCKLLLSCTKQNAVFFNRKYFVTHLQTINTWEKKSRMLNNVKLFPSCTTTLFRYCRYNAGKETLADELFRVFLIVQTAAFDLSRNPRGSPPEYTQSQSH